MSFSYDNLWKILKEKNMSKDEFRMKIKASQTTIVKMGKNDFVSLDIIDRICSQLKCSPNDIMQYIPDDSFEVVVPNLKRGDLYFVTASHFSPDDDCRPVVIYQNNILLKNARYVFGIPLTTSRMFDDNVPVIQISPDDKNNLPAISYARINALKQYRVSQLNSRIGHLDNYYIQLIDSNISMFLGISPMLNQAPITDSQLSFDSIETDD